MQITAFHSSGFYHPSIYCNTHTFCKMRYNCPYFERETWRLAMRDEITRNRYLQLPDFFTSASASERLVADSDGWVDDIKITGIVLVCTFAFNIRHIAWPLTCGSHSFITKQSARIKASSAMEENVVNPVTTYPASSRLRCMISKISVSCSIMTICFRTLIFNKVKINVK
jgi:hypothetical protein